MTFQHKAVKWMAGVLVVVGSLAGTAAEPKDFYLKDGDRVAMLGDGFTEGTQYADYVELWTLARFPAWKVEFWRVARPADMAHRLGPEWFQRDVSPLKPTVLTVCLGFNDGAAGPISPAKLSNLKQHLRNVAVQARRSGVERVAWLTLPPIEMMEDGPVLRGNESIEKFVEVTRETAAKEQGMFVDLFTPYLAVLEKSRAADPKQRLTDRVPVSSGPNAEYFMTVLRKQWGGVTPLLPGPDGSALIAATLLKTMRFPALVSVVEIDGLNVTRASQCEVTELQAGQTGGLQFKRLDAALPFFPDAPEIRKRSPILEEMNDYRLKVTGLKPGKYEIRMDGEKVAEYTAEKLAEGVNLAGPVLANGPIAAQVKRISEAVAVKNKAFQENVFKALMPVVVSFPDFIENREELTARIEAEKQAEFGLRMREIAKLEDALRQELVIKPHVVAITPAGDAKLLRFP